MFRICVERVQHAAGHGGFHSSKIIISEVPESGAKTVGESTVDTFRYVYDCGSEEKTVFKDVMAAYGRTSEGNTDILFVSHLHSDHIDGIERLQAQAPATTVVVPYLDVIERLVFILFDIDQGSISTSAIEYFGDPVAWWIRRGAKRIIFIQAGGGDDVPPIAPEVPTGGGDETRGSTVPTVPGAEHRARIATNLIKPQGRIPNGLTSANSSKRELDDGATIFAGPGSSFHIEYWPSEASGWQIADWMLLPYVHPIDKSLLSTFKKAVMSAVGIKVDKKGQLTEKLIEYLTSYEKRKVLIDLYGNHLRMDQNALSMSLYSGPLPTSSKSVASGNEWNWSWWEYDDAPFFLHRQRASVGWLSSGDAALKQSVRRDPWLKFFAPLASDIGILTLPHHGSSHNFHEEIIRFGGLRCVLATTVERKKRVSGMRKTIDIAIAKKISAKVVDNRYQNTFRCFCHRDIKP